MKWLSFPGWATENHIFSPLVPEHCSHLPVDFHFFSEGDFPQVEDLHKLIAKDEYGIICYSMGTLPALQLSLLKRPVKIIIISGFSYFPGFEATSIKLRKRQILKMIRGLQNDPETVVKEFTKAAGLDLPEQKYFNQENLIKGLELLKECDMSLAVQQEPLDILTICGKNDTIVPHEITQQLMNGTNNRQMITLDGEHGIIQSHKDQIKAMLEGEW